MVGYFYSNILYFPTCLIKDKVRSVGPSEQIWHELHSLLNYPYDWSDLKNLKHTTLLKMTN